MDRIYEKVNEIVSSKSQKMPTLMQLHKEIYAPLMECKTLDEAKKIFPEFAGMKDANDVFVRNSGNIKKFSY